MSDISRLRSDAGYRISDQGHPKSLDRPAQRQPEHQRDQRHAKH